MLISTERYRMGDHPFVDVSIRERLPKILHSLDMSKYDDDARAWINAVMDQFRTDQFIIEDIDSSDGGPDWTIYLQEYIGNTSAEVDWFFLENYLYRILLRKLKYFKNLLDPFHDLKRLSLEEALKSFVPKKIVHFDKVNGRKLLLSMLWGNRNDLSLSAGQVEESKLSHLDKNIVIDKSSEVFDLLVSDDCRSIGIVLDNCGMELCCDLEFVFNLITHFKSKQVVLYTKAHPVFVSDAMTVDVHWHMNDLKEKVGLDLQQFLGSQLMLLDDNFFTSPLGYDEVPSPLKQDFVARDILLFKGDANYRRLLGDKIFSPSTKFSSIVNYFDIPVVTIRTNKSPIIAGISEEQEDVLNKLDKDWRTNGKFGIIDITQ